MYIRELFDSLAYGEFSDTRLVSDTTGTLDVAFIPKIISFTNLGLLDLYKRFMLLKKKIILYEQSDKTIYYLRSVYVAESLVAVGASTYFLDSTDYTFNDDLIKLIEVFDSDEDEVALNNTSFPGLGLFTNTFDTINLVNADSMRTFTCWYQARYPYISYDSETFNADTLVLAIPPFILEALLYFIGSRFFKSKVAKSKEAGKPAYNTYEYLYEQECLKIERQGFVEKLLTDRDRFSANNFT